MANHAFSTLAAAVLTLSATQAAADVPSFEFNRLATKIPAGVAWLTRQEGLLCVSKEKETGDGVLRPASMRIYSPIFGREFALNGFSDSAGERPNLFESASAQDKTPSDYQIGALIHSIDAKACLWGYTDMYNVRGSVTMKAEWQIYSVAEKKVVRTIQTTGTYTMKSRNGDLDPTDQLVREGFAANVRALAKSPELASLISTPIQHAQSTETAPGASRIAVTGAPLAPRAIGEAAGAVVVVSTGTGHGSGVLISNDGFVLTNQHVVGTESKVKIRWSDGLETQGEVVRSHKGRDVALIKTDPRNRLPLSVRTAPPQPGDTLLAIGAPLDEALQGTVTRGVMSANRVLEGYSFIQSDVMVNPGNSGGPLVDERGAVVGLTDIGFRPDGVPAGLNFFIPIKDALDFMSVDLTSPPAPPAAPARDAAAPQAKRVSVR